MKTVTMRILVCAMIGLSLVGCRGLTFRVPTNGMSPVIKKGDTVLVDPTYYAQNKVKRFDIVVVKNPDHPANDGKDPELYVKRVIAFGGEKVQIKSNKVYINDVELSQSFAVINNDLLADRWNYGPIVVPQGEYFLLGDNRVDSLDSRFWKRSTVDDSYIYGKVTRVRDESGALHDL